MQSTPQKLISLRRRLRKLAQTRKGDGKKQQAYAYAAYLLDEAISKEPWYTPMKAITHK